MVFTGGVFCLKQRITCIKGNVASCGKSSSIDQVNCKQALEAVKNEKKNERETLTEVRLGVNINAKANLWMTKSLRLTVLENKHTYLVKWISLQGHHLHQRIETSEYK